MFLDLIERRRTNIPLCYLCSGLEPPQIRHKIHELLPGVLDRDWYQYARLGGRRVARSQQADSMSPTQAMRLGMFNSNVCSSAAHFRSFLRCFNASAGDSLCFPCDLALRSISFVFASPGESDSPMRRINSWFSFSERSLTPSLRFNSATSFRSGSINLRTNSWTAFSGRRCGRNSRTITLGGTGLHGASHLRPVWPLQR